MLLLLHVFHAVLLFFLCCVCRLFNQFLCAVFVSCYALTTVLSVLCL